MGSFPLCSGELSHYLNNKETTEKRGGGGTVSPFTTGSGSDARARLGCRILMVQDTSQANFLCYLQNEWPLYSAIGLSALPGISPARAFPYSHFLIASPSHGLEHLQGYIPFPPDFTLGLLYSTFSLPRPYFHDFP